MTSKEYWLPAFGLALLLPGCVVPKSVGDDPEETADLSDSSDPEGEESSDGASSETSDGSGTSTTGLPPGVTTGQPDTAGGVTTAATGNVDPFEACGVEPSPANLPGFEYMFECGSCTFDFKHALPLGDEFEVGECLCNTAGCGGAVGGVAEGGGTPGPHGPDYMGVCDVDIEANDGDGYYEQTCHCQVCDVRIEDISPGTFVGDDGCNCLCLEAGCGYSEGSSGSVSGGGTGGETESQGGTESDGGSSGGSTTG